MRHSYILNSFGCSVVFSALLIDDTLDLTALESPDTTMAFTYHALARDHVRLLKVPDPWIQGQNEQLQFTVLTVPLSSAPAYSAISYVWGLGSASKEIYLDGRTFAVRTNLWSCLHYIRKYQQFAYARCAWRYIWVDAICINQVNTAERNQQVRMMDRIFSQATEVSAWLGLQQSSRYLVWREASITTMEEDMWALDDHLFEISWRPYWSRMWIVQELLQAREVRFFVSDASFDFRLLADVVEYRDISHDQGVQRILKFIKARHDNSSPYRTLHELLIEFSDCECQDPRDNVFALLSLVEPSERSVLEQYFPDYTLSHDAVVAITLSHLQNHSRLAITAGSKAIFDSLGVVPSKRTRGRLVAASEAVSAFYDHDTSHQAEVVEPIYYPGMLEDDDCPGQSISHHADASIYQYYPGMLGDDDSTIHGTFGRRRSSAWARKGCYCCALVLVVLVAVPFAFRNALHNKLKKQICS